MNTADNQTFFVLFAHYAGQSKRLETIEWPMIRTVDECIEALRQNENTVKVFQVDYDSPRRDVSEDIAREWLKRIPTDEAYPAFIAEQFPWQAMQRDARVFA